MQKRVLSSLIILSVIMIASAFIPPTIMAQTNTTNQNMEDTSNPNMDDTTETNTTDTENSNLGSGQISKGR